MTGVFLIPRFLYMNNARKVESLPTALSLSILHRLLIKFADQAANNHQYPQLMPTVDLDPEVAIDLLYPRETLRGSLKRIARAHRLVDLWTALLHQEGALLSRVVKEFGVRSYAGTYRLANIS